jgi:hypothetical protein
MCSNCGKPLELSAIMEIDKKEDQKDARIEHLEAEIAGLKKDWQERLKWQSHVKFDSNIVAV